MTSNSINEDLPDERPDDQLAFSRIKDEIESQANSKAEIRISEAKQDADEIISTAKEKANRIKQELINQAINKSLNTKIREVSRKKLGLKMDYLTTREQLINEIQLEVKSKLQKFTQSPEYSILLSKLIIQSGLSIGGGNLTLYLRSEDKSLFNKDSISELSNVISEITKEKTKITVAPSELKTLGGVKLVRKDNRLYVDNTFETRLARAKEPIRVALHELLS